MTRGLLVIVSVILAVLTYFLIERPLRWGGGTAKTTFLVMAMTAIAIAGYGVFLGDGIIEREKSIIQVVNEGDVGHDEFHRYYRDNFFECTPRSLHESALRWKQYVRCYQSKENVGLDVALIGDSHSEHLFVGLAEALRDKNVVNYVKNALPSINNANYQQIFTHVANDSNIKVVIIAAFWSFRGREVPAGSSLEEEVSDTVEFLLKAGKKVYLIQDTPSFSMDPTTCKYERLFRTKNVCSDSITGYLLRNNSYMPGLENIEKSTKGVTLLRVNDYLCDAGTCSMNLGGNLLYRDRNHLNIYGSRYLGKVLFESEGAARFH
jgi:hypothetical protein